MLCHRRQPSHQPDTISTFHLSSSQYNNPYLDQLPYSPVSPQQPQIDYKLLQNFLASSSAPQSNILALDTSANDQFMTSAYSFQSPAIRIQQSTPVPQFPTSLSQSQVATDNAQAHSWNMQVENDVQTGRLSLQTPTALRKSQTHNRALSASSIGSSDSSASTYHSGHATSFPYIGGSSENLPLTTSYPHKVESSPYLPNEASRAYSNHLPTPSQTPTHDSFLTANFQAHTQSHSLEGTMTAHAALKQMMMDQHSIPEEEAPGFSHSGRHSVSSYGQDSPATPHTAPGDDFEDKYQLHHNDVLATPSVPKLDRTLTEYCADELYNPSAAAHTIQNVGHSQPTQNTSLLSPYHRNVVNERLHAAHVARSQSPATTASREVSPFRRGSPWLATAAQERERQKAQVDARAMKRYQRGVEEPQKTISPKESLLDYHEDEEDHKVPLFSDAGATGFPQYHPGLDYSALETKHDWSTPKQTHGTGLSAASGPSPPQTTTFNFVPPAVPGSIQLPFSAAQYRAVSNMPAAHEQTPEFPAHLTSMESSASEAGPETNSQSNHHHGTTGNAEIQKPAATTADTGTYTCTYHGCTLRFETPQKLQKHKREAHRQNAMQSTPGIGSGMTSAALQARNSQAGPHKCERINPTTGKPCNTIFSRPYDLTRHEDTIHNARKQKVRCALCVEEKTFSRNDALTRHMRVVHPEVDFPGKNRRRGQASHD